MSKKKIVLAVIAAALMLAGAATVAYTVTPTEPDSILCKFREHENCVWSPPSSAGICCPGIMKKIIEEEEEND